MNCAEVKQLLSAYYDAELSADVCAEIAEHLEQCVECSAEHARFEALSELVQSVTVPVPQDGWQQLQVQLDRDPTIDEVGLITKADRTSHPAWPSYRVASPVLALAALLLVVVGWLAFDAWRTHGEHNLLAADFEHYVSEFQKEPDAAQRMLVSKYEGQKVDLATAVQRVSYRPAAARLPDTYKLDSMFLLKMPCCDCLQTVCQRRDGSKITLFEYGEEQPMSTGDRTGGMAQCRGENCCLVQINDKFAMSKKRGDHHISVVGVRDPAEMASLVAWLD